MDAGTYVRVQSIFFEVSVVFSYKVTHFMIAFLGNFVNLFIQAHLRDTDSCWSGYSSGSCYFIPALYLFFFQGRSPPRVEFTFLLFKQ